jgi:hypothetical protein
MNKKQIWMLLFLVLLFVPNLFVAASMHQSRGRDFRGFTVAADRLMERTFMYKGSGPGSCVTWPLFFAVFMIPLALLSKISMPGTQMLWYCLNCVMLYFTIGIWCRLVYGNKFDGFDYKKPLSIFSSFVFLPVLFAANPILDNAVELQVNLMQLFFISLGLLNIQKNKDASAGFWFGLATAIKVYPLIFVFYLLFRRKFKAASMLVFTAVLLTLLPILWYGPHDYIVNMKAWFDISVHGGFPLSGSAQGVYSFLGRWFTSDIHTMLYSKVIHPPLDAMGSILTIWTHRLLFAVLLGAFFFLVRFRKFRDTGFEGAFITLLMILFSPVAWKHYYVMILPAVFVLWKVALTDKNKVVVRLLWISFVFIPVMEITGAIVRPFRDVANYIISNYTMAGFSLLAALFYLLWIYKTEKSTDQHMLKE